MEGIGTKLCQIEVLVGQGVVKIDAIRQYAAQHLLFPLGDLTGIDIELLHQLPYRQVSLNSGQCNLGLEFR